VGLFQQKKPGGGSYQKGTPLDFQKASVTSHLETATDAVGVTDSVFAVLTIRRTITDSVGVTDATTILADHVGVIAEPVGVTDTVARQIDFKRTVTEAVGVTDIVVTAGAGAPDQFPGSGAKTDSWGTEVEGELVLTGAKTDHGPATTVRRDKGASSVKIG
jgi:hypothetical protein